MRLKKDRAPLVFSNLYEYVAFFGVTIVLIIGGIAGLVGQSNPFLASAALIVGLILVAYAVRYLLLPVRSDGEGSETGGRSE